MSRAVVLGAGIAGLVAAFRRRSGPGSGDVVLLEPGERAAGSVRTLEESGLVLEAGPNTLRGTPAVERLLADLGLGGEVLVADPRAPRWVVRAGRPRAVFPGPRGLLTPAVPASAKLRALAEPLVPRRPEATEDESVHAFFLRRFGAGVARYVAGPLAAGVYADDPATLSARSAFPGLWEAEGRAGSVLRGLLAKSGAPGRPARTRTLTFRRGLRALPEALVARLPASGATLVTGAEVASVEGPVAGAPCPWRVRTADGRSFEAERLVSTLDARRLVLLLGERLPRSAPRLRSLCSVRLAVVLQAYRVPRPERAPRGFGCLVPRGEGFRTLGLLTPSSLFPGRAGPGVALATALFGGALDPGAAALGDEELAALAEEETRRLHPGLGERLLARVERWPAAIPRLPVGHHETLAALDADLADVHRGFPEPVLLVTGPFRDGVSLADRVAAGEAAGARI